MVAKNEENLVMGGANAEHRANTSKTSSSMQKHEGEGQGNEPGSRRAAWADLTLHTL